MSFKLAESLFLKTAPQNGTRVMHKDEIEKFDYFPQELIEKMKGISDDLSEGTCKSDAAIQRLIDCCQFLAKRVRQLEEAASS